MKLLTFKVGNTVKLGLLCNGEIVDLPKAYAYFQDNMDRMVKNQIFPQDMLSLLEMGDSGIELARAVEDRVKRNLQKLESVTPKIIFNIENIELLPPVTVRKNIICLGLNYADHAAETNFPIPEYPVFFTKSPTSIVGNDAAILYPDSSDKIDYEVELAFVFGRKGKNIPEEEAYNYIAGYTILNDVTARDLQRRYSQWFKGKSLDTFAPMGPWLVTKDEIPDPHNLDMELRLNGELMQKSNTKNMIFKIPSLVKHISLDMTVEPGDIVATGTPAGVGFTRKPPRYLKHGDIIEACIERIGTLRNTVKKAEGSSE